MKKYISVLLIFALLSAICGTASAYSADALSRTYYLFGYINGANYACEEDHRNMGEYRFNENGTLTATFDSVSYVAVKEEDNACWYMTDGWQYDVYSVELYNTEITGASSNKLKVPGGTAVTFNLKENADGSLTLSYTAEDDELIRSKLWYYVHVEIEQFVLVPGNYWTEETEKPFSEALKAANKALDNLEATDAELTEAYDDLKKAEAKLERQSLEYWKQKLGALIAEYSADFEDIDAAYRTYTKESFDRYYEAYSAADSLLASGEQDMYKYSESFYRLRNARRKLTPATADFELADDFFAALNDYLGTIGLKDYEFSGQNEPVERILSSGKRVVYYGDLRFYEYGKERAVFALTDMFCTVGEEVIDGWLFSNPEFFGVPGNKSGFCVYKDGRVYGLAEAVEKGVVNVEEMAQAIPYSERYEPTEPPTVKPTEAPTIKPTVPTEPKTEPTEKAAVIVADPTGTGYYVQTEPVTYVVDDPTKPETDPVDETEITEKTEPETTVPVTEATENTEATEPDTTKVTEPETTAPITEATDNTDDTEPETTAEEPSTAAPTEPEKTDIRNWDISGIKDKTYTGKAITQKVLVSLDGEYASVKVRYKNNLNAGTATVIITGTGEYSGTIIKTFTINKAKQNVKLKKLKTSAKPGKTIKAFSVSGAKGKYSVKAVSGFAYFKPGKSTGKITIKKNAPKGTYKLKIRITAAGNKNFKPTAKTLTIRLRVKN